MRCFWVVPVLVVGWLAVACQTTETPPAATPCGVNTAVTVTILDETNSQLDGVQVSYRVNGGEWVEYPERVNGRVTLQDAPGTYEIRAQKPGHQTANTIVPLAAFTCEGEPALATLVMSYAQCPTEPVPLYIQLPPAASVFFHVTGPDGRDQTLSCQEQSDDVCHTYVLPMTSGNVGNFLLWAADLPGVGEMEVVDGVVAYAVEPFEMILSQGNRQQTFDLAGTQTGMFTVPVNRDEVGCPLVDLTAVTLTTEPADPDVHVFLAGNVLMTDLGAAECQPEPVLTDITYAVTLPAGVHLDDIEVIYWRDEEWATAVCRVEDGQYLCTAQLPNPLIGQAYAVRAIIDGQEYVGTQLPMTNLCIVFDQ